MPAQVQAYATEHISSRTGPQPSAGPQPSEPRRNIVQLVQFVHDTASCSRAREKKGSKEEGQLVCEHQGTMCRTVCLAAMPHVQPVDGRIRWCDLPEIHRRGLHCDTWRIVLRGGNVTSRRYSPDRPPERSIVHLLQKAARMHTDSGCCQRMFLHLHERLEQPPSRHHGTNDVVPTHCGSWSSSCLRARSSSTPTRETDRFLLDDTFASTGVKTSGKSCQYRPIDPAKHYREPLTAVAPNMDSDVLRTVSPTLEIGQRFTNVATPLN